MCKPFTTTFLCCLCYLVTSIGPEFLNLADTYRRNVSQSSTYGDYVAENAVDGNTDQNLFHGHCSSTRWDESVWWRIQFKDRVYIQRIIIYYRNDGQFALRRFRDSKVYISDVSGCDGQLIFTQQTDTTDPWTDTFNITGEKVGIYLSICNSQTYMNLCEVLVIGCPYGKYGDQCSLTCGHCHQSTCDLYSGTCPGDCENMYMGPMCNIPCVDRCQDSTCSKGGCTGCVVGKHGVYCDQQCPLNCRNNACTEDDAVCTECKKNKVLNENCSNACSSNCNDKMCVQKNGVCYGCTDGYWGSLCNETCPKDCESNICNQTNGYCTVGCNKGFWGDYCNNTCPAYCFQSECSQDSGICEHGCNAGHRGQHCTEVCPYGSYGDQCAFICGHCHQSTCDLYSGTCPGDCENTYMGPMCNITCIDRCQDSTCSKGGCTGCVVGKHGVYCDQQCPLNCRNNACTEDDAVCTECKENKVLNENCSNACISNCNDKMCVQENGVCYGCNDGYWGSWCNETCPKDCKSNICNQINGYCTVGCNKGFWGDYCNNTCPAYCFQSECSQNSGICEHGCNAGHRGQDCTEEVTEEETYAAIAGGVAAVIVVAAVAVVIIVIVKRRRNSQPAHTATSNFKNQTPFTSVAEDKTPTGDKYFEAAELKPRHNHNAATEAVYMNTDTDNNEDTEYYNTTKTSSGILVDDLKEYIKAQREDEFQSIFSKIMYGPQFEHDVGQRKENNSKNRFIDIIPYDHSRVKLQKVTAEHHSDYINANYIDSLDSEKVYIAAQGPKQNTIEDTWRMIVQEKSGKIVMLTNLMEGKKKKCERYWPLAGEKMELPGITLTLVSEEVRPFYIIRNINLSVEQKEQIETMQVIQFHFTSWPDHGVANPRQLVVFHRRVVHTKTSLPGPLIVHCSAGIGRTGTFIGLDALVTYGKLNKLVDVSGYVERMRRNRMNMVQTAEQLQLLHETLYEALMYPGSSMFRNDFLKRYEQVQRRLSKEYQILQAMLPEYPPYQYSDATMKENKDKNRNQSVIPPNKYRPYLRTYVPGTTDYINAVIVSGSVKNSEFLVTQLPLANTVIDFWRMIYDNCSNVVVLLNPLDIEQNYPPVLPSEGFIIKVGHLEIKLVSRETMSSNITQSVVNISQKNCKEKRDVKVLYTTSWKMSEELPPSKQLILDLVESVTRWQHEKGRGFITVQCMNGVTCSGLYCVVSKVIQQIKIDQEVDVFQAVREMQICRPQFIESEEQYRFCYEIAMDYLRNAEADVYVNVDDMA